MSCRRIIALLLLLSISVSSSEVLWADVAGASESNQLVSESMSTVADAPTVTSATEQDVTTHDCVCLCTCACAGTQSGVLVALGILSFGVAGPARRWSPARLLLGALPCDPHVRPPLE